MRSCECLSTSTSPSGPQSKIEGIASALADPSAPCPSAVCFHSYTSMEKRTSRTSRYFQVSKARPWHATYKAPSHTSASIKVGNFSPSSARSSTGSDGADERTRRTERELVRRRQQASRLTRARESILDYRLGIKGGGDGQRSSTRINPVSLKGWPSLVEDRIEKARLEGQFSQLPG